MNKSKQFIFVSIYTYFYKYIFNNAENINIQLLFGYFLSFIFSEFYFSCDDREIGEKHLYSQHENQHRCLHSQESLRPITKLLMTRRELDVREGRQTFAQYT